VGDASLTWLAPGGGEMQLRDWHDVGNYAFACQIRAAGAEAPRLMLIFNPEPEMLPFTLTAGPWQLLLDSSGQCAGATLPPASSLLVPARSLLVLRHS